jgi:hypothetical protein
MKTSAAEQPGTGAATADCRHLVRRRDNNWGFASPETVCVACGEVFDAQREEELRERDCSVGSDALRVGLGKGYVVG